MRIMERKKRGGNRKMYFPTMYVQQVKRGDSWSSPEHNEMRKKRAKLSISPTNFHYTDKLNDTYI